MALRSENLFSIMPYYSLMDMPIYREEEVSGERSEIDKDILADVLKLKIEVDPPVFEPIGRDYVFEPNEE